MASEGDRAEAVVSLVEEGSRAVAAGRVSRPSRYEHLKLRGSKDWLYSSETPKTRGRAGWCQ